MKQLFAFAILTALPIGRLVAQTWSDPIIAEAVNGTGGSATRSSMQVVNGNPAIAYRDDTHKNLLFVRATNVNGTSWAAPVLIDWEGDTGDECVLQVVNGNPAICFYDRTAQEIQFVRANDSNGTSWGAPVPIATGGGNFSTLKFEIISGNPAVAFVVNESTLYYVRANDADGAGWGAPVGLGAASNSYELKTVNGNPAIFYKNGPFNLKYVRATNTIGSTWGTAVDLTTDFTFKEFGSMQIVDGFPAIGFVEYSGVGNLKFRRANDANGDAWAPQPPFTQATMSKMQNSPLSTATLRFSTLKMMCTNSAVRRMRKDPHGGLL